MLRDKLIPVVHMITEKQINECRLVYKIT